MMLPRSRPPAAVAARICGADERATGLSKEDATGYRLALGDQKKRDGQPSSLTFSPPMMPPPPPREMLLNKIMHELVSTVKIHLHVALDALNQAMRAALTSPQNWLHRLGERAAIMVMVFVVLSACVFVCCVLFAGGGRRPLTRQLSVVSSESGRCTFSLLSIHEY